MKNAQRWKRLGRWARNQHRRRSSGVKPMVKGKLKVMTIRQKTRQRHCGFYWEIEMTWNYVANSSN